MLFYSLKGHSVKQKIQSNYVRFESYFVKSILLVQYVESNRRRNKITTSTKIQKLMAPQSLSIDNKIQENFLEKNHKILMKFFDFFRLIFLS